MIYQDFDITVKMDKSEYVLVEAPSKRVRAHTFSELLSHVETHRRIALIKAFPRWLHTEELARHMDAPVPSLQVVSKWQQVSFNHYRYYESRGGLFKYRVWILGNSPSPGFSLEVRKPEYSRLYEGVSVEQLESLMRLHGVGIK